MNGANVELWIMNYEFPGHQPTTETKLTTYNLRERSFWMLNVECWMGGMLNYELWVVREVILNVEF